MEALPRLIGPAHVPFGGRSAVARTKWRMNRCLERPAIQPTTRSVTLDASLWGDTRCVNRTRGSKALALGAILVLALPAALADGNNFGSNNALASASM